MGVIKNVVISDISTSAMTVDVHAVTGLEGFDKLLEFLKNEYTAEVIHYDDGPDCRIARINVDSTQIELKYENPYGNSLRALGIEGNKLLQEIGTDLCNRLKGL